MAGLSIDDPVTLAQALASKNIYPGDTLRLRAGTYAGDWVANIGGTQAAPVRIMPYNGEKVTIDGTWTFNQPYLEVYDVEITNSDPDRHAIDTGITMNYPGCWLIGCDIHDLHSSGANWFGSGAGGIVECMIRNNGYISDDGGHGHGIYTHNNGGGARSIARNVFFDQLGNYTIHIYSGDSNALKDYTVEDNIICGDPVHTGGGLGLIDFIYRNNFQFGEYCQQGRYSGDNQNINGQITGNTFIDLVSYSVNADCTYTWDNLTEADNLVYGGEPASRAGYTLLDQPATLIKLVQFTKSERWLGSLAVFNRDSAQTVSVDFSSVLSNGNYRLRNGQNPSETWDFVFAGSAVGVPMDIWSSAARIGDTTPPTTYPIFGAFVIEAA